VTALAPEICKKNAAKITVKNFVIFREFED